MGNCGTKPKTSDGDDAPPPPIEPQPAAGAAAEGERKDEEVAAPEPEGTSQAVVAPQSEVRKNDLNSRTALSITQTMALFAIPIEIQYVGLLLYDMANFRESHVLLIACPSFAAFKSEVCEAFGIGGMNFKWIKIHRWCMNLAGCVVSFLNFKVIFVDS